MPSCSPSTIRPTRRVMSIAKLPLTADDFLFRALPPKELFAYARSSKDNHRRVEGFKRRAFNFKNLLKKYFSEWEVDGFCRLLAATQMFISGSTALQFFERVVYPDSDLDLYVEKRYIRRVAEWLLQNNWQFRSWRETSLEQELDPASRSYTGRGVHNVYNFYKHHPERKIQVIASTNAPLEIVLNFHSTCVMNLITHEKAYSLYPKATFVERRSLMYSTEGVNQEASRQKYVSRGWPMVEKLPEAEFLGKESSFYPGFRYIGDSQCWTIPIHHSGSLSESFIEVNSWALRFEEPSEGTLFTPHFKRHHLVVPNLQYDYIIHHKSVHEDLLDILKTLKSTGQKYDMDVLQHVRGIRMNMCFRFGGWRWFSQKEGKEGYSLVIRRVSESREQLPPLALRSIIPLIVQLLELLGY